MKKLTAYNWPGNVREIENTIERAIILCNGPEIGPQHIWTTSSEEAVSADTLREASLQGARAAESEIIRDALIETGGNKSKAARRLKVSYRVLLKKIKDYEISIP